MRTKLLALALTAMLTIGTGGVLADGVGTDDVQFENDVDDATQSPHDGEQSADDSDQSDGEDDEESDEEYDEKLTADEHISLEPSVLSFEGDGIIRVSFQEPTQESVSVTAADDDTLSVETGTGSDVEASDASHIADQSGSTKPTDSGTATTDEEYDEKLTADEHVTLEPNVISFEGDGIIGVSFQEPTHKGVTVDATENGTVSVTAADA